MPMKVWKMCLSAKLTCAKEMEPLDLLEHPASYLAAPVLADVGNRSRDRTMKVMSLVTSCPGHIFRGTTWDCPWLQGHHPPQPAWMT